MGPARPIGHDKWARSAPASGSWVPPSSVWLLVVTPGPTKHRPSKYIYAPGSSHAYIQQNYQDITTHVTNKRDNKRVWIYYYNNDIKSDTNAEVT